MMRTILHTSYTYAGTKSCENQLCVALRVQVGCKFLCVQLLIELSRQCRQSASSPLTLALRHKQHIVRACCSNANGLHIKMQSWQES